MKLVYLASRSSIHTVRWVNAFAERSHQVTLFSMHEGGDWLRPNVALHILPVRSPAGYFLNAPFVRRALHAIKPDVVHVHYASGYGTLGRLARIHPLIVSVWGGDVYEFPFRSALHRRWLEQNLGAADWICSTSKAMLAQTRTLCDSTARMSTVPFGIDSVAFSLPEASAGQRPLTIGTVKSLATKYGIDVLIRAFARVKQLVRTRPGGAVSVRCVIVGDGPQRAELQALAHELDVEEDITFVGKVPHSQVVEHLKQLDIYVAVSRSESFGVAILEASACGLPVVVSDVGGLPEVVQDGQTGLIVPSENPTALAAALMRLVEDRELRRRLGEAGRQHVIANYEWSQCVNKMQAIYQAVAKLDTGLDGAASKWPGAGAKSDKAV